MPGALPAGASAQGWAGAFAITLVATSGAQTGRRSEGRITLARYEGADRQVMVAGAPAPNTARAYYGSADVNLEGVGALRLGQLDSMDPMSPGVAILEERPEGRMPSITMRLGSLANQRRQQVFDGGYTALRVTWIEGERFGGTWASGKATTEAGGYFCASRTGGSN